MVGLAVRPAAARDWVPARYSGTATITHYLTQSGLKQIQRYPVVAYTNELGGITLVTKVPQSPAEATKGPAVNTAVPDPNNPDVFVIDGKYTANVRVNGPLTTISYQIPEVSIPEAGPEFLTTITFRLRILPQ